MDSLFISEIWDALRAAAEGDLTLAQAIIDSAGVIVQNPDLTVCYDERGSHSTSFPFSLRKKCHDDILPDLHFVLTGAKYELPKYVLSEPTNLIHDTPS